MLAEPQNWYTGLFLISQPPEQTPNVGLVFRHQGQELVLFFRDLTIERMLGGKNRPDRAGRLQTSGNRMRTLSLGHAIHNFADDFSGRRDFFGSGWLA